MITMCSGHGSGEEAVRHQRICYDPHEGLWHLGGCPLCFALNSQRELEAECQEGSVDRIERSARWESVGGL